VHAGRQAHARQVWQGSQSAPRAGHMAAGPGEKLGKIGIYRHIVSPIDEKGMHILNGKHKT
jgi:hypothetical protein